MDGGPARSTFTIAMHVKHEPSLLTSLFAHTEVLAFLFTCCARACSVRVGQVNVQGLADPNCKDPIADLMPEKNWGVRIQKKLGTVTGTCQPFPFDSNQLSNWTSLMCPRVGFPKVPNFSCLGWGPQKLGPTYNVKKADQFISKRTKLFKAFLDFSVKFRNLRKRESDVISQAPIVDDCPMQPTFYFSSPSLQEIDVGAI